VGRQVQEFLDFSKITAPQPAKANDHAKCKGMWWAKSVFFFSMNDIELDAHAVVNVIKKH